MRDRFTRMLLPLGIIIILTAAGLWLGAKQKVPRSSRSFFAMDTYITLTCYGSRSEEACEACEQEIKRLEDIFSTGRSESEISRINARGEGELCPEVEAVLKRSLEVYDMTEGAFDITVYPVMELWGFYGEKRKEPDPKELEQCLSKVGSDRLEYDETEAFVRLPEGAGIDMGAIAKGYAGDALMKIFEDYGLSGAVASLGGNVVCYGKKPEGGPWKCGIRDPQGTPSDILKTIEVEEGAVVTSGSYERYFVDEDTKKKWHHILDPKTGYPADTGLLSVTIVSRDATLADALSTACFVMGEEKAAALQEKNRDLFRMVLVREDGEIITYR